MNEMISLMTGFAEMNAKQQVTSVTVDMAKEQGRQQKLNNFANFLSMVGKSDTLADSVDDASLDKLIESYNRLLKSI